MLLSLVLCLFQGWYAPVTNPETRIVYVSSSTGNDNNSGLSPNSPKRTIQAAKPLMRHQKPDQLLLKRGDVFDEPIGRWTTSGLSKKEKQVIGGYGAGERPLILSGNSDGLNILQTSSGTSSINHIAVLDIEFYADEYDGVNGIAAIALLCTANDWLIEGCKVSNYQIGVFVSVYGGPKNNVTIRRNVIVDCYATVGSVGHGIYASAGDHLVIDENVIDKNGWNEDVPGAIPTIFRHGIYLTPDGPIEPIITNNIISRSASHGLTLRRGGTVDGNLFIQNSINVLLGGGSPQPAVGGVSYKFTNNVVVDAKDIDPNNPRGWAIQINNTKSGLVKGNIFCHNRHGSFSVPMMVENPFGVGVKNVRIHDNIWYAWGGTMYFQGTGDQIKNIGIADNIIHSPNDGILLQQSNLSAIDFSDNTFYSNNETEFAYLPNVGTVNFQTWRQTIGDEDSVFESPNFVDPTRDIETYNVMIGGEPSIDDFLRMARKQSRTTWNSKYTAREANTWIRTGFEVKE